MTHEQVPSAGAASEAVHRCNGMDFSVRVTAETGPDQRDGCSSENKADVASPTFDRFNYKHLAHINSTHHNHQQYPCSACPLTLGSSIELTAHLRIAHHHQRSKSGSSSSSSSTTSNNSVISSGGSAADCSEDPDHHLHPQHECSVCHKLLNSESSLDRHSLIHTSSRPYRCKLCDMAFSTNGNMSRHLRTAHHHHHNGRALSPSNSCTDSEAGSSSGSTSSSDNEQHQQQRPLRLKRRLIHDEYNNNDVGAEAKRKCLPEEHDDKKIEVQRQCLGCGACGRQDFTSLAQLEAHVERNHPELPAKCDSCNLAFKNHRALNLHRSMFHYSEYGLANPRELRNSVVGFDDLTFVDFSSDKFPAIARAVCEQSLHRPPQTGETPRYQCTKCLRAFPCRSALDAHEHDCGFVVGQQQQQMSQRQQLPRTRDDFFAGLDLQNKAALVEAREGKDLADIQSIISVTSSGLHSLSRAEAGTPDNCKIAKQQGNFVGSSSGGSTGTPSSEYNPHEEEAQDAFAAEFRRMKLKGEFPCRLCTAIFPNLRALKGHNRAHMGVAPGMPYPCNMCPYSSTDKATLVRHLRSHNGDRPYECSLCNYAFTTKANCERHVRNRHGKLTRDEIKSVLIYHPSEDSTNDGSLDRGASTSPRVTTTSTTTFARDEVRKSLVYPDEQLHHLSQLQHFGQQKLNPVEAFSRPGYELADSKASLLKHQNVDDELDSASSDGSVSLVSDTKANNQRIQQQQAPASPIDLKKTDAAVTSQKVEVDEDERDDDEEDDEEAEEGGNGDAPLDLSMDVLDLSRKAAAAKAAAEASAAAALAKEKEEQMREEMQANGLTSEAVHAADPKDFYSTTNQLLLTQALLKAGQMGGSQVGSFFANAHMMYRNLSSFPSLLQPYIFNPLFAQDYAMKDRMQKELVRGLQTSGGSLVEPPTSPGYGAAFPQQPPQNRHHPQVPQQQQQQPPQHQVNGLKMKEKHDSAASSVKLVIKNGILIPKQKQRRYRTERPFTCEHCSARFTLRSNMERHIKQQHPHHWIQRPKNQQSTRGRPPANPPTLLQNLRQPLSQQPAYPSLLPKLAQPQPQPQQLIPPEHHLRNNLLQQQMKQPAISDQVKYAILAQQLKGNRPDENDSDEELVIDEAKEPSERTLSLLRGKLEASIESRACVSEEQQPINATIEIKKEPIAQPTVPEVVEKPAVPVKSECDPEEDEEEDEDDGDNEDEEVKAEVKGEGSTDLASVSEILDNASQNYQQQFSGQYMSDEEGLVASTSDCNQSGSDDCKSDSFNSANSAHSLSTAALRRKKKLIKKKKKKKSAYSMAPNRVICPYCQRPFPWTSSLRRHILTHTGQKPYQCKYCSLLFTTKSNCDRHLLRKHKANVAKARRNRSTSSPELQQPDTDVCPTDLLATTMEVAPEVSDPEPTPAVPISEDIQIPVPIATSSSSQFALRNVPERPYKCNQCPSSTFSTLGNLKKHRSSKHPRPGGDYTQQHKSRPESPVSEFHAHNSPHQTEHSGPEDCSSAPEHTESTPIALNTTAATETEEQPHDCTTGEQQSGYESHSSGASDSGATDTHPSGLMNVTESISAVGSPAASLMDASCRSRKTSPTASPGPTSETPFKCHLCDSGFAERQDCLEHIKDNHESSYEILVAKGALDMDIDAIDDAPVAPAPPPPQPSDGEERRGRFPDYSNRKVVCAFCMRRFWSAEDLRRHMRTHTGERPFSCDICYRRFTLKHSMLRHRKKHESVDSSMYVSTSGDEDGAPSSTSLNMSTHHQQHQQQQHPTAATPRNHHQSSATGSGTGVTCSLRATSLPQVADAAPSFNPYDKLSNLTAGISASLTDANDNTDNDLISNLLGIRDKSIIDRVLQASADDAAKLLGVKGNHE